MSDLFAMAPPGPQSGSVLDFPRLDHEQAFDYDLRPGTPDPRLFPVAQWKRYTRWAVDRHQAAYGDPAGLADLRLVLARWIARSRGVDASFRQLIVTSGAQQAFYVLLRSFAVPGDKVAIEDPGYHRFRSLVHAQGLELAPVPVDEEGVVVDAVPADAKVVYVTPSHQFPSGVTMSLRRRLALLELARDQEMLVIEDDYDSEFRYVLRPLEPLYRLDRNGLVAYVASFSKTLSPALRLGYVVVPPDLLADVVETRLQVDWAPSQVDQLTLRGYIADGEFDRHLRKTRRVYQRRHSVVTDFFRNAADRGLAYPTTSYAGLHISARLDEAVDEPESIARLAKEGVAIGTMDSYSAGTSAHGGLVLGFGHVDDQELDEALQIVARVLSAS